VEDPCPSCQQPVSTDIRVKFCPFCGVQLCNVKTPKVKDSDMWETPREAIVPLLPFIPGGTVWEPMPGSGGLAEVLRQEGRDVVVSRDNFFNYHPTSFGKEKPGEVIVSNPPFGSSSEFVALCFALRLPFALLLPVEALGGQKRAPLWQNHGLQLLVFAKRVDFIPPEGRTKGNPNQVVAWFCHGFNLPQTIMWAGNEARPCAGL